MPAPLGVSWLQVSGGVAVSDWAPHDEGGLVAPMPSALAGRPRPRQLYVAGTRAKETVTNASDVGLTAANGAILTDLGITTPSKVNASWWSMLCACVHNLLRCRCGLALFHTNSNRAMLFVSSQWIFSFLCATQHSSLFLCSLSMYIPPSSCRTPPALNVLTFSPWPWR